MSIEEKIIVALDTNAEGARALAKQLSGKAQWLKVGMTLFYQAGPSIVSELKEMGFKIFVDLKLHDIPHQVRGAAHAVVSCGADMLTVHAAGGAEMMRAAVAGAEEAYYSRMQNEDMPSGSGALSKPLCLAISVLTSLDSSALESIGVNNKPKEQVLKLAQLAQESGMDGIVCSPQEAQAVRLLAGSEFSLVTPGVRPSNSEKGDQARVATPAQALKEGASYLVIGRPITAKEDPVAAFEAIVQEIGESA